MKYDRIALAAVLIVITTRHEPLLGQETSGAWEVVAVMDAFGEETGEFMVTSNLVLADRTAPERYRETEAQWAFFCDKIAYISLTEPVILASSLEFVPLPVRLGDERAEWSIYQDGVEMWTLQVQEKAFEQLEDHRGEVAIALDVYGMGSVVFRWFFRNGGLAEAYTKACGGQSLAKDQPRPPPVMERPDR